MGQSDVTRKRLSAGVLALTESDADAVLRLVEALRSRSPQETIEFVSSAAPNGRRPKAVVSRFDPETHLLAKRNREGVLALRKSLLADSITTDEARTSLGLTRQGVAARVERRELFAIRDGRKLRFPRWQFDDRHATGVVRGLPKVLRAGKHLSDIEIASWFVRAQPSMGGDKPTDALRAGEIGRVVRAIQAVGVT